MRTSFVTVFAGLVALAAANPTPTLQQRQTTVCSSGTAQCCDVDVLGVADLDCTTPPTVPTSVPDFNTICANVGKINMCCDLTLLQQGLICTSPDTN